jgi:hypothetical protein
MPAITIFFLLLFDFALNEILSVSCMLLLVSLIGSEELSNVVDSSFVSNSSVFEERL